MLSFCLQRACRLDFGLRLTASRSFYSVLHHVNLCYFFARDEVLASPPFEISIKGGLEHQVSQRSHRRFASIGCWSWQLESRRRECEDQSARRSSALCLALKMVVTVLSRGGIISAVAEAAGQRGQGVMVDLW